MAVVRTCRREEQKGVIRSWDRWKESEEERHREAEDGNEGAAVTAGGIEWGQITNHAITSSLLPPLHTGFYSSSLLCEDDWRGHGGLRLSQSPDWKPSNKWSLEMLPRGAGSHGPADGTPTPAWRVVEINGEKIQKEGGSDQTWVWILSIF